MGRNFFIGRVTDQVRCRPTKARHIHESKDNQHDSDCEFHAEAKTGRDGQIEENDRRAYHENGQSVTKAPECADQRGPGQIPLPGDDGGDGDDVVGVRGMAHTQKESHGDNGEQADHVLRLNQGGPVLRRTG